MKLYTDIFTGDEMISDSYKQLLPYGKNDLMEIAFEVESSKIIKGNEDFGIATNAEDEAEMTDANNHELVLDIVDRFNLIEINMTKKDYINYIKRYMKNVMNYLETNNSSRADLFKAKVTLLIQMIITDFDNCSFYIGQNSSTGFSNAQTQLIVAHYSNEEITPRFIYLKDTMNEVKC